MYKLKSVGAITDRPYDQGVIYGRAAKGFTALCSRVYS